jgi:glutamate racemase
MSTPDNRPIGVFDSGLGGLTAVRELFRVLPDERVVYFGDTARVPYGSKSRETITRFSLEIARFLLRQDAKVLLVACNTSSSYALETLKRQFEIPVVGVIDPAAGVAVTTPLSGAAAHEPRPARVGVIGTQGTIASGAYARALAQLAPGTHVVSRACPLFVPMIEEGWLGHPVLRQVAEEYLAGLREERLDSLILGCTHYPLILDLLQGVVGPDVRLVDSGAEAALATAGMLRKRGMLAVPREGVPPGHRFFVSDQRLDFERVATGFLGRPLPPTVVVDQTDLPWFERSLPH